MIVTFLENLQKELLEDQFSLEKEIHHLRNQMNQNQTMLDRLKREQDERLESFSPRDVLPYQKDLLHHFEEEHEDLQQRLDQAYDRQSSLRIKLEELDSVLKVARLKKEQAQLPEVDSNRIAILETQENERQRISRELHDSTIQNLTSIVYKAELCSKLIDQDPIRCRLELLGIGQTLREIISDTREMIYNLRPMSFDDIGLDITIERALDKLESSESKKINFTVEENLISYFLSLA
jgi:two-component system sensor histidine kinase DegS